MGRYLNESDQRATTVLNANLRWLRGPESIRLRKVTLHTCAKVLGLFPKYWACFPEFVASKVTTFIEHLLDLLVSPIHHRSPIQSGAACPVNPGGV